MSNVEQVTLAPLEVSQTCCAAELLCASDEITVRLNAEFPAVVSASSVTGALLDGALPGEMPLFRIQRTSETSSHWSNETGWRVEYQVERGETVRYHGIIRDGQTRAIECDLLFQIHRSELVIEFANLVESPSYQLLSVRLPALASVSAGRSDGRMLLPWCGGRLIDPAVCKPQDREHPLTWWDAIPAAAVYHSGLLALVEMQSADDVLRSQVKEDRLAGVSAEFVYRHAASRPELQFVAHTRSQLRVRYLARGGKPLDWTDAARLLRGDLQATPPALYDRTLIYKVLCDYPAAGDYVARTEYEPHEAKHVQEIVTFLQEPRRRTQTFDEVLELVRKIHHQTCGLRQVVYLVGWQHKGHDTGYPDVFTINDRLGGLEGLRRLMAEAKRYNAVISFHDNFDDAYRLSPSWDERLIARREDGELCKGGIWAGGRSYILSAAWYADHGMRERVQRTIELLGVQETYHIDVLSAAVRRLDYSPAHPAGVDASIAGKLGVIEEFNRCGIDVTSEALVWPFVGTLGHGWTLRHDAMPAYEGEEQVPFAPFVFHGHATHGGPITDDASMISAILYGHTFNNDLLADTPLEQVIERIYLVNAPYLLLRDREMESFDRIDSRLRVGYGPDPAKTYVDADLAASSYHVVVDGRVIFRDFSCFVPGPLKHSWIAYSRPGGELVYASPEGWQDGEQLQAEALAADGGRRAVPCDIGGGQVRVCVPAGEPVLVQRLTR